jgi:hypothetical protein
MKSADLKLGVEYGVIPSWDYSSNEKKNPETTRRRDVARAELISLDKYTYEVYRSKDADDPTFVKAEKGARSVGYLVKSDQFGETMYWITRAQDVVAEYAPLETRWANAEAEAKRLEAEEARKREEAQRREREEIERAERIAKSVTNALRTIIGNKVDNIEVDWKYKRNDQGETTRVSYYQLDTSTMQLLVEKVLEARDSMV